MLSMNEGDSIPQDKWCRLASVAIVAKKLAQGERQHRAFCRNEGTDLSLLYIGGRPLLADYLCLFSMSTFSEGFHFRR